MKVAIITGITGQDGSYLAEFLLSEGYMVFGLARRSSTQTTERIRGILGHPNLVMMEFDCTDALSNNAILSKCSEFDTVEIYNLAAQSHVLTSFEQPWSTFQMNASSVYGWLEAIRQCPFKDRVKFYQAGTSEMYGKVQEVPQTENTPFYPRSPYGVSKLAAFWACKNYRESYGLFICNGILFNHESERRGNLFVTKKIVKGLLGEVFPIRLGNLDASRDWGHAQDYVRGMWLMLQEKHPDDYVLATGITHTVREFINECVDQLNMPCQWIEDSLWCDEIELVRGGCPEYMRPSEVDILVGNPEKARVVLGWEPTITLKTMVSRMIEYECCHRTE